jgi:hypothetical protein
MGRKTDIPFEYYSYSDVSFGEFSNSDPNLFILRDQSSFQIFLLKDDLNMEDCLVQTVINDSFLTSCQFCFSQNDEYLYSTESNGIVEYVLVKGKFLGEQIKKETTLVDIHFQIGK